MNVHHKAMENAFRAGFVKAGGDPESFSEFFKGENMWNYDPRVSKKTDLKDISVPKDSEGGSDTGGDEITWQTYMHRSGKELLSRERPRMCAR